MAKLEVRNLSIGIEGKQILKDIDITFPEGKRTAIIGPNGAGKSTLLKALADKAEQKGEPIQRIHCASDPDSLDGVIFLDKRAAIVDATAPHVMEPDAPGAEEQVVSLYHTLDADALLARADEVKRPIPVQRHGHPRDARIMPESRDFH